MITRVFVSMHEHYVNMYMQVLFEIYLFVLIKTDYRPSARDLTYLTVAPWSNTVGYINTRAVLMYGRTIVFLPRFNERLYLQCIEKFKASVPSLTF